MSNTRIVNLNNSVEEICEIIRGKTKSYRIAGRTVLVEGVRLETFAYRGTDCICCGRKGLFWAIDHNAHFGYHLNLYTRNSNGREVLMTRDHAIAKSFGGPETVENMNPMCERCNKMRGNKDLDAFLVDWKEGKYRQENKGRKFPQVAILGKIDRHVDKYGVKSHILKCVTNVLSKKWKREEVVAHCKEIGDGLGQDIAQQLLNAGDANRKKVSKAFRAKYMSNGYEGSDPRAAYGILQSLARQHLDNPTDESEIALRTHLEICKGIKL